MCIIWKCLPCTWTSNIKAAEQVVVAEVGYGRAGGGKGQRGSQGGLVDRGQKEDSVHPTLRVRHNYLPSLNLGVCPPSKYESPTELLYISYWYPKRI